MPAISLFNFDGADVRIVDQNGDPWFVAKDVMDILGLDNATRAVSRIDEDDKADFTISKLSSNGTNQRRNYTIISESGLYSLILTSRKPDAKRFKKWVTSEVLPSIRKTGSYTVDRQAYLREALTMSHPSNSSSTSAQSKSKNSKTRWPKTSQRSTPTTALQTLQARSVSPMPPKLCKCPPVNWIAWMSSNGWIYKRRSTGAWVGYQKHTNRGFMEHKVIEVNTANNGVAHIAGQVRVTPQGLNVISSLMNA